MSDVLGYVVVEWRQGSSEPESFGGELYGTTDFDLELAHEAVRMLAAGGSSRYSVHAVMAKEIEEGS